MVVLLTGLLPLSACQRKSEAPIKSEPAKVEHLEGTELSRVTLTARAAERLGIKTAPLREQPLRDPRRHQVFRTVPFSPGTQPDSELSPKGSDAVRKVIAYASVLYDLKGNTWVYTSPESLVFVRHPITVDYIDGDLAILLDGPPAGTELLTVGVAEMYGTEFKVGH